MHFLVSNVANDCSVVWDNVNKNIVSIDSRVLSAKIKDFGNGWTKVEISFTSLTSTVYAGVKSYFSDSSTNIIFGISVGSIAYQTRSQVEALPYATSYIPNFGNSAGETRGADSLTNFGSEQIIDSESGIFFAEISGLPTQNEYTISLNNNQHNIENINRF